MMKNLSKAQWYTLYETLHIAPETPLIPILVNSDKHSNNNEDNVSDPDSVLLLFSFLSLPKMIPHIFVFGLKSYGSRLNLIVFIQGDTLLFTALVLL